MVILRHSNKYLEIKKKIGSNAMMGDFTLELFVFVYLICNKIGKGDAQIHL